MKWEEIEFEKLEVGDVFTHGTAPDRAYHIEEIFEHDADDRYLLASNILKRTTTGGLCFSGHGEPYYKLVLANTPGIDELAARNAVLQEQLAQKTDIVSCINKRHLRSNQNYDTLVIQNKKLKDRVDELLEQVPLIEW